MFGMLVRMQLIEYCTLEERRGVERKRRIRKEGCKGRRVLLCRLIKSE